MAKNRTADGFTSKTTPGQDAAALAPFQARLGSTPDAWLRWALGFAQRDLGTAGPGERQDLCQDLRALPALMWRPIGWRPMSRPMREADLFETQNILREGLERFAKKGGWTMPGQAVVLLETHPKTRRQRVAVHALPGGAADGGIVACVVELLCRVGETVRACPARDCGRLFLRFHKQSYCSPTCAQVARNDKYYEGKHKGAKVIHRPRKRPA